MLNRPANYYECPSPVNYMSDSAHYPNQQTSSSYPGKYVHNISIMKSEEREVESQNAKTGIVYTTSSSCEPLPRIEVCRAISRDDTQGKSCQKGPVPVIDLLHLQTDQLRPPPKPEWSSSPLEELSFTPSLSPRQHSPSMKSNLFIPKRRYSTNRKDSLDQPVEIKMDLKSKKEGPSSPRTALTMTSLFICGVILSLSGFIVLLNQRQWQFVVTGGAFVFIGFIFLTICFFLQRKNVIKFILDVSRDLHFLRISDSYMWRLVFEVEEPERHLLPVPPSTPFSLNSSS
ncbi:hypothetical protein DdX_08237 [Ditylenchus destructor]|uniref:Uncharacterized protein n=1 Tax=Ditylenchus destructor TaxID=166010 RepID=A0AAD4N1V0_9BILA|nr:hypothetical protein DdX_08237 [Ditylenchus destructor]